MGFKEAFLYRKFMIFYVRKLSYLNLAIIFNFILKGEIMSVKNRLIALSLVFILSLLTISTVSYFKGTSKNRVKLQIIL